MFRKPFGRWHLNGNNWQLVFASKVEVALIAAWHGHDCARGARMPLTNRAYWQAKIAGNMARDAASLAGLRKLGWKRAVIWECETKDAVRLARLITKRVGILTQA